MTATIVYLHGFNSAPASIKATQLGDAIAAMRAPIRPRYLVPKLDPRPAHAVRAVVDLVASLGSNAVVFVGSSLGGFYASHLAERYAWKAVLINPAIHPERSLAPYLGVQRNPYTGEVFELTREHFAQLTELKLSKPAHPSRYYLLTQTGDELLDWREAVRYCAGGWQRVEGGGSHAFENFVAVIPSILNFALAF